MIYSFPVRARVFTVHHDGPRGHGNVLEDEYDQISERSRACRRLNQESRSRLSPQPSDRHALALGLSGRAHR
jgi:hypothetical protein